MDVAQFSPDRDPPEGVECRNQEWVEIRASRPRSISHPGPEVQKRAHRGQSAQKHSWETTGVAGLDSIRPSNAAGSRSAEENPRFPERESAPRLASRASGF